MLDHAERIYPFRAQPHLRRALLRLRQNLFKEALVELKKAEKKEGVTAEILFYRGKSYRGMQDYEKALQCFHRALRRNPDYRDAYNELGALLGLYRKYDLAERAFRLALTLDPDDYRSHNNLGNIHRFRNQPEKAVGEYRTSLRLRDNSTARYNLAMLLIDRGERSAALSHLYRALPMTEDPSLQSKIKAAIFRLTSD